VLAIKGSKKKYPPRKSIKINTSRLA